MVNHDRRPSVRGGSARYPDLIVGVAMAYGLHEAQGFPVELPGLGAQIPIASDWPD
jgi:hypothetical protein